MYRIFVFLFFLISIYNMSSIDTVGRDAKRHKSVSVSTTVVGSIPIQGSKLLFIINKASLW